MKSFIRKLRSYNDKKVVDMIKSMPETYGETDVYDFCATDFYEIVGENEEMLGFFGISYYQIHNVICYVYIFEEYRRLGLFNKLVKYCKDHSDSKAVLIGAKIENTLADSIYSRKFTFYNYQEEDKGNWYVVKREKLK